MSNVNSFRDSLIGFAREHKRELKRAAVKTKKHPLGRPVRAFGHELAQALIESGYFEKTSALVFGDALEGLLDHSTPTYRKRT